VVRILAVIRRKDGLTYDEFVEHWRDRHPEFVHRLPGLRRYVQSSPLDQRRSWPFDGLAELWFDSVRDVAAAFASPAATPMRDDEARFIGSIEWILAEESGREMVAPAGD
jgi:uncharacterized protein (TIGR02118 family)